MKWCSIDGIAKCTQARCRRALARRRVGDARNSTGSSVSVGTLETRPGDVETLRPTKLAPPLLIRRYVADARRWGRDSLETAAFFGRKWRCASNTWSRRVAHAKFQRPRTSEPRSAVQSIISASPPFHTEQHCRRALAGGSPPAKSSVCALLSVSVCTSQTQPGTVETQEVAKSKDSPEDKRPYSPRRPPILAGGRPARKSSGQDRCA